MSPQAQLLLTGTIEVLIGLGLGGLAYWSWKRRAAARQASMAGSAVAVNDDQTRNAELLNELARLVLDHTQSVEAFQKCIESAPPKTLTKPVAGPSLASRVQTMRAANHRFNERAESRSTDLSIAAGKHPDIFGNVSVSLVDHRRRTNTFENALESVPADGTMQQVQQLTSQSLQHVLETKQRLESELADAKRQIEHQAARLRAAELDARVDPLTRLSNRRAFDEHLETVHGLHERSGVTYSLLMLDIDRFKSINDSHGHAAGDAVLQVLGKVLQTQSRLSDRAFRLGGEEFVLVLSATNLRQAEMVAERVRKRIEASTVHFEGRVLSFTASVGAAEIEAGQSSGELLERADEALYAAKGGGRNRVELAPALNTPMEECSADAVV